MSQRPVARCISCRAEVSVPDSYAEGSQIACGSCGTQLKVVRTPGLRLVIADLIAMHQMLRESKRAVSEASRELQAARASWGIGVNGFGIGVLYVVAQVALDQREFNRPLVLEATGLAVGVGVLLELANHLFLAKRWAISRLTDQLKLAVADQRELERKIRESSRR